MAEGFGEHISWFVTRMGGIRRMLPSFSSVASTLARDVREDLDTFISQHVSEKTLDEHGRLKTYVVPTEHFGKHRRIRRALDDVHVFRDLLPKMAIIALVSAFDSYLGKLVRSLYAAKPEALNASNRQLTYSQLAAFKSLEEAREHIIEKEVESLLRESHVEQFEWLETKVGIPLRKDLPSWPAFVEVTERRNLFVHTDGIVSSQYLAVCGHEKVSLENMAVGSDLGAPRKYFIEASEAVIEIGVKLGQVMWRKLVPEQLKEADSQLTDVCYELLTLGEYRLAAVLGEFACFILPRHSSAEAKLIFHVNLAQAYKWLDRPADSLRILDGVDWSPLGDKFQLAAAVLRDDYSGAVRTMKRMGTTGDVRKDAYQEWPLFRQFRTQPEFLAAYEEVFGEPFKLVHSRQSEAARDSGSTTEQVKAGPSDATDQR